MSYFIIAIICLSVYGLALLIGIFVAVYFLGKQSIKNNPNEAFVFLKTGDSVKKPFKAKLSITSKGGQLFFYYNKKKIVFSPEQYKEIFYCNKRMIFINGQGQIIASPFENDIELSSNEKNDLIYELVSSHIGADGMRALKGNPSASIIIVAIVALAIGAILSFGVIKFIDVQKQNNTIEQTQQTQEIQETPVKVK